MQVLVINGHRQKKILGGNVKYIDIDSSISFDLFTKKKSQVILDRLDKNGERYKLLLSMKAISKDAQGKIKLFEVKGSIKIKNRGILLASNKNKDPKKAVSSVTDSLEKQIRRWSEKTERSRKTMGKSLKTVRDFKLEVTR
jgi:ribosome-associated translation inhibitor RaiA